MRALIAGVFVALAAYCGADDSAVLVDKNDLGCVPCSTSSSDRPSTSTSCSSSSSSSSDSWCPCPHTILREITIVERLNFDDLVPEAPDWDYYAQDDYVADDGVLTFSCKGGLLNSKVYTKTAGQTASIVLDNYKYFLMNTNPVLMPVNGTITLKMTMGSKSFKVNDSPYPSEVIAENDYRAASSFMAVQDPATGLLFAFLLTNDRIYAVYQRTPVGDEDTLFAFEYVQAVKKRQPHDLHHLAIVFDDKTHSVYYKIGEETVFLIDAVGLPYDRQFMVWDLGGAQTSLWPEAVVYGFGTAASVDTYPACKTVDPCQDCHGRIYEACHYPELRMGLVNNGNVTAPLQYNPILGPFVPAEFFADTNDDILRIWGQGTVVNLQHLLVYTEADFCYY